MSTSRLAATGKSEKVSKGETSRRLFPAALPRNAVFVLPDFSCGAGPFWVSAVVLSTAVPDLSQENLTDEAGEHELGAKAGHILRTLRNLKQQSEIWYRV